MNSNRQQVFETYPIPKAVWSLATPTVIGMIVTVLYNLVDTFFIGQTGDPNQVAAVSLAMPFFFILMAFGNLFGIGTSSFISRKLGAREYDKVASACSFAFYSAIVVGIIACAVTLLNTDFIALISGSDEFTEPFVVGYMQYIALGAPFIILSNAFGGIVRSEGHAKVAMFGMILGTVTNIVLDPLFIFTFNQGVAGAALATAIANVVSTLYYIIFIIKSKDSRLSLKPSDYKIKGVAKDILFIGVPASLTNILFSLATIVYNSFLSDYGNDPVAAMGIVSKVTSMYVMIFFGITMGVQPLIGYSFGAKNYERLKGVLRYVAISVIIIGTVSMGLFYLTADVIVKAFIDDPEVIAIGERMIRIQATSSPILGLIFITMSTMQASGKSFVSLILAICRQGLAFIPIIVMLDTFLGFDGLIWAQPVSDFVSIFFSGIVFIWYLNSIKKEQHSLDTAS